ncbi:MAG: Glycerol-3-phosphate cytidyltransferase TagD [Candidatus Levybacteria bacterium GW2011_GWB1_35_5]|nr:MAG: Glycerol-3-phosphate cytidyltransferase TagD [Candidatus Levybacteria bacterium GW2011_GWB1_35_5]
MGKVLDIQQAIDVAQKINSEKKVIVLAGGCFDVLHIGHIKFLEKARQKGDYLFILLESDESVKKLKGNKRPINSQDDRAQILSALKFVDFVILLNGIKISKDYDDLVEKIHPDIIAVTQNDNAIFHKQRQAKKINAKVISVMERLEDKSTTRLAKLISQNF